MKTRPEIILPFTAMNQMKAGANEKMRLEWLQVLRGVAAMMVVFCHMGAWEAKAYGTRMAAPHFLQAGESGVDVFFVISGFIMVYITPKKLGSLAEWGSFLYRRFARIFPPYWTIVGLLLLVWLRKPQLFNNYYHNQVNIVCSIFLLPQLFTPILVVGWSLIHEVYFYFVIAFLFCLHRSGRIASVAIWSLVLLGVNLFGCAELSRGSPVMQLIFSPFSLEFQMGMIAAFAWKVLARWRLPIWGYFSSAGGGADCSVCGGPGHSFGRSLSGQ